MDRHQATGATRPLCLRFHLPAAVLKIYILAQACRIEGRRVSANLPEKSKKKVFFIRKDPRGRRRCWPRLARAVFPSRLLRPWKKGEARTPVASLREGESGLLMHIRGDEGRGVRRGRWRDTEDKGEEGNCICRRPRRTNQAAATPLGRRRRERQTRGDAEGRGGTISSPYAYGRRRGGGIKGGRDVYSEEVIKAEGGGVDTTTHRPDLASLYPRLLTRV